MLFVSNHQVLGVDSLLVVNEIHQQCETFVRPLTHPILYYPSSSTAKNNNNNESPPDGTSFFETFGCLPVSTRNFYRLLQTGQAILLFPGGIQEAFATTASQPYSLQEWTSDRPFRILMVGDGPLRSDLERQASEIASPHRIEFIGRKNDVAPIIATSDALVLPSHFEGMPNVVLESMALATPVIATRAGGTVELEREEPTVLWAEPRNPRSIARAILDFATNPTDAERRVSAATQLVRDHHDVTSTTRRIEKYLERACVSTDT